MFIRVLWFLWVACFVTALLAIAGFDLLHSVGSVDALAGLLGLALTLGVFLVFLLAGRSRAGNAILRSSFASSRRGGVGATPSQRSLAAAIQRSSMTRDDASYPAWVVSRARSESAPAVASEGGKVAPDGVAGPGRWPWEWAGVSTWLAASARRVREAPLNRLVLPSTSTELAERLSAVHAVLDKLVRLEPVPTSEMPENGFAQSVSEITGAVILLDAVGTRGGVASEMHVWHSQRYEPSGANGLGFELTHAGDGHRCGYEREFRAKPSTRPDDYDGRVLTLRGAALVRDVRRGGVSFLVDTAESCYAATEYSEGRCKHLRDGVHPRTTYARRDDVHLWERRAASAALPMLTTSAAVLLDPSDDLGERSLLVMRRSRGVRHGAGGLAIPGGVMNLGIGGVLGDESVAGSPDPVLAVARELREETGVDIPTSAWTPLGLVLVNERTRGSAVTGGASGQLVATAIFMATIDSTLDGIRQARDRHATYAGRYEAESLEAIAMPRPVADNADAVVNTAASVTAELDRLSGELDQRSIVAALYVAERLYGAPTVLAALTASPFGRPWWARAWAGEAEGALPRRLVDPEQLLRRDGRTSAAAGPGDFS